MPNWCNNDMTLRHSDPAMIQRAADAYRRGELLNEFIPVHEDLKITAGWLGDTEEQRQLEIKEEANIEKFGYKNWYDWCISKWGTKWDVGGKEEPLTQVDANTLEFSFDSAWSPPIEAYNRMVELGFEIEAHYYEPGMAFFGTYNGSGEEVWEDTINFDSMTAEQIRTQFPEDDERWNISEWLEDRQENLEIDLDGGLSAINEEDKE